MSGLVVVYECSNTPVDPSVFERVMDQLNQRGPDGRDVLLTEHAALGHWHFWTTPEEVGERQPLELSGLPFKIVLDGRLDNRPELISGLQINPLEGSHLSDAALILHAYDRWAEHCFEHFIGEFALVILDERRGELICARDALGDRTLFYAFTGSGLIVASEAWAVACADGPATDFNESAIAHFFALQIPDNGQSLFDNVFELFPASGMRVNATGHTTWRYWQPDPSRKAHGKTDIEYAEQFREILEESVRCRLRSTTPVGVLMSGGLDSGSVACLAARMLQPQSLTTISYVFDELHDCDERQYIEAIKQQWGIHSIQIPCDDAWPLKDWKSWPLNPNMPEANPFRLLKERAYDRAHNEGLRVMMTGAFGDEIYCGEGDWLADLLVDRGWREVWREFKLHLQYFGLRQSLRSDFIRVGGSRLLSLLIGGRRVHRTRQTPPPDWLTPYSTRFLSPKISGLDPAFEQKENLLGRWTAADSTSEIRNANRHSLELRHPYRDQRLVEFALTLPGYQLYQHGFYKYILRMAMQGILPEPIRSRYQPTHLGSLFLRGFNREKEIPQNCFQDSQAEWSKFVRQNWISDLWNGWFSPGSRESNRYIAWFCISYETWYRSVHFSK